MRAAILETSQDKAPHCGDVSAPEANADQQIVELVASGIHHVTRGIAMGQHYSSQATARPVIPGIEGVARTEDGTLIYTGYPLAPYGTLAERFPVPPSMHFPLPDGADPIVVAAGVNPGLSSWLPLRQLPALGTVIVTGATGVSGQMAVANARLLGATRVIALGRSRDALDALPHGVTTVALTGETSNDAATIRAAIGDESPSMILDYVWGSVAATLFAALQAHGLEGAEGETRYMQIGSMGGHNAVLPAALLRARPIVIAGSGAGSVSTDTMMQEIPAYLDVLARGDMPITTHVYPLERVAEAWTDSTPGVRAVVVP